MCHSCHCPGCLTLSMTLSSIHGALTQGVGRDMFWTFAFHIISSSSDFLHSASAPSWKRKFKFCSKNLHSKKRILNKYASSTPDLTIFLWRRAYGRNEDSNFLYNDSRWWAIETDMVKGGSLVGEFHSWWWECRWWGTCQLRSSFLNAPHHP